LPYAKPNRWDPRAGIDNKGFNHLLVRETREDCRGKQRKAIGEEAGSVWGWDWAWVW